MSPKSWLLPDDVDRERMLDMDRRLQPVRRAALGVLAVALLISGPWLGFWTLLPLVVAGALFWLADQRLDARERPENAIFAAWAGSQVVIAVAVAISGGAGEPTLGWLAIPVVTLSARFSLRGVALGVGITLLLMAAVAFGVDAQAVFDYPPRLIAPAAMVVAIAILSTALMHSDVEHRSEAVIDPLTSMLNRNALAVRAEELSQQSALTGEPVGVVIGDLDHFKRVNDSDGHSAGDAVLRDVAYVIRKTLRAFDLAYRLGGEEFLILIPGADIDQAVKLAEHLREAVEAGCASGYGMTMSFGVSTSERGTRFDYEKVFARADAALYEAKRGGRNRVCDSGAAVLTPA
jgi:diguanylate cyclase (GGDEF)-like protein